MVPTKLQHGVNQAHVALNSSGLNLMDYYVWGAVQAKVNHPLVGHVALQERIRQVMRQMEQEEGGRTCVLVVPPAA